MASEEKPKSKIAEALGSRDEWFFSHLEEILDEQWPKGDKDRGRALVLFAFANIFHEKSIDRNKKAS